jgi:hypothetical protein
LARAGVEATPTPNASKQEMPAVFNFIIALLATKRCCGYRAGTPAAALRGACPTQEPLFRLSCYRGTGHSWRIFTIWRFYDGQLTCGSDRRICGALPDTGQDLFIRFTVRRGNGGYRLRGPL